MQQQRTGQPERVLSGLADLVNGGFAERVRLDAAARMLVLLRRAFDLARRGELPAPRAEGMAELEALLRGWCAETLTAAEYVEGMQPEQLRVLTQRAPAWAAALLRHTVRGA